MTFPAQKSFGDFTRERFGPNWVYGHSKKQISFARNGERQTVITKKEQRQLHADYKREWSREYDAPAWQALCALRTAKQVMEFQGVHLARSSYDEVCEAIKALTT